jgi:hypothetical protein
VVDGTRVAAVAEAGSEPVAHDRAHVHVDIRREAAIEAKLLVAHVSPQGGGRVVDVRQAQRLLELVRAVLGEEDPGERLAQLDRVALAVTARSCSPATSQPS